MLFVKVSPYVITLDVGERKLGSQELCHCGLPAACRTGDDPDMLVLLWLVDAIHVYGMYGSMVHHNCWPIGARTLVGGKHDEFIKREANEC